MTELSPAAEAVFDALNMSELNGPQQFMALAHAAAALRAAADQVVPARLESYGIRYELLRIADELEAQ
jgi:hypothetical protein